MSQPSDDTLADIRSLVAELGGDQAPGGVLAVMRGGEVIFDAPFGQASVEHGVPNSRSTVFYIASTSKQFVAASIALLEAEGRIDIESDIREFLPEMHAFDPAIRVFHLLHHTSGLRDKYALAAVGGLGEEIYSTDEGSLELLKGQRSLNFPLGSRMMYSNSNYFLLAQIVERVSGLGFEEFTRTYIFEPMGMHDTRFRSDATVVIPHRASGYRKGPDGAWRVAEYTMNSLGPGGVVTTVGDLAKWSTVFFGKGGLGLPDLADRLTRTRPLDGGGENRYAFGLMRGSHLGRPTVSHAGGVGGFAAELVHFTDDDLSVACLANTSTVPSPVLAQQAAAAWLGLEAPAPAATALPSTEPGSLDPGFEGAYLSADGEMILRVEVDGPQVTIAVGAMKLPVQVVDGHTLVGPGGSTIRLSDGQLLLTSAASAEPVVYRRLEPGNLPDGLEGEYWSAELDVTLRVSRDEAGLTVSWPRGRSLSLEPAAADVLVATSAIMGMGIQLPVRIVQDGGRIVALELGASRALANRFDRID